MGEIATASLRAPLARARALLDRAEADIAAAQALDERIQAIRLRRRLALRGIARAASAEALDRMLETSSDALLHDVFAAELERRRERAALDRELAGEADHG